MNIFGNNYKRGTGDAKQGLTVDKKAVDETNKQTPTQPSSEEKPATNETEAVKEQERPSVPKKITCTRCKGDGIYHSNRTGQRAATSFESLVDPSRRCPKCKGKKEITIFITHEQANMEIRVSKAQKQAKQAADKARAAADYAEKLAKETESKLK